MKDLVLLLPSTFTADEKNQHVKAYKVGEVARAATTFGVTRIIIYYDKDPLFNSLKLGNWLLKVFSYVNTPPYLRKALFEKDSELKSVGVVPPIAGPHHQPELFGLPYRYGVVSSAGEGKAVVELGSEGSVTVKAQGLEKGDLALVDAEKEELVSRESLKEYFGFEVSFANSPLPVVLKGLSEQGYYILGTSRKGKPIHKVSIPLKEKTAVVFGSAYRGLLDLLSKPEQEQLVDLMVNLAPSQNSATMRTEEAVYYSLFLLNYLHLKGGE